VEGQEGRVALDIFDDQGKKIAHLLHYVPEARDGDIILVKVGREFGLTEAERANIADVIHRRANGRVRVVVVDESTTIETVGPGGLRGAR